MLQQAADDMAKPSHRHSPQDGAPRGIRRRAVARRVHDAAPDVQQDVDVEEEMVLQMEARALAVLLAGRQHPGSRLAPPRQRRSRVTSRGSAGQSPQSRRSSRGSSAVESSSSASCQGSYSHLSISSLQSLVNRYDAVHEVSSTTTLSFQSSLVDRLNRVLQERDAGNSSYSGLEGRGSDFLGIQPKEIMVLAALVMFPPVALLAAMAALLYFS